MTVLLPALRDTAWIPQRSAFQNAVAQWTAEQKSAKVPIAVELCWRGECFFLPEVTLRGNDHDRPITA